MFAADVTTGGEGLFLAGRTDPTQLARAFRPAPGGGVFGFGVLPGTTTLNGSGEAAFGFFGEPFLEPIGRNARVYRATGGALTAVVVPGVTPAPTGGVFVGVNGAPSIDDRGLIALAGMIPTEHGISGELGVGVFLAAPSGAITPVVVPGDPAPGGGRFDFADQPTLNARGDIAFGAHVVGTPCTLALPQDLAIGCARDLYLRHAESGQIRRLVALGDPAPGGGVFRSNRFPIINATGDVLFQAIVETEAGLQRGLFLARGGAIVAVARAGDEAPGGGRFVTLSGQPGNWDLNDRGDVSFSVSLDTDANDDGLTDQGLYRWTEGTLSLIARSGTGLANGGEIVVLQPPEFIGSAAPFSGALSNNARQVLFAALVRTGQFYETILYVASGDDLTAVRAASSIGDLVWSDLDGDGLQDAAEPGVGGARVSLLDPAGRLLSETESDSTGHYRFDALPTGDYVVRFRSPTGFVFTQPDQGSDDVDSDADPATGRTPVISLVPGRDDTSLDAGLRQVRRTAIGDFAWVDADGDGVQDLGESGFANVLVTLLDGSDRELATSTTTDRGFYIFPRLAPGDYRVRFTPPAGFGITTPDAGGDDARDSDAHPETGLTANITLSDGENETTIDAGFTPDR